MKKHKKAEETEGESSDDSARRVSFYIVQELRLSGTVEFGQMSSHLKPSSHQLLNDGEYLTHCTCVRVYLRTVVCLETSFSCLSHQSM